jgi:hypothetical protein
MVLKEYERLNIDFKYNNSYKKNNVSYDRLFSIIFGNKLSLKSF